MAKGKDVLWTMMSMIRQAELNDLDQLVAIENQTFTLDRFSRRTFRYLLSKANAVTLVADQEGQVAGYVMVLFHTGTSLARLYSLAVAPQCQGQGVGADLIRASEEIVIEHGGVSLRLEVREDNQTAIALYQRLGYRQIGVSEDYYEDHGTALRFEKRLSPGRRVNLTPVPYYEQTLDFTCGPAALMMAMHALKPELPLSREFELRLWRESTSIFMTSGHGGCGPYGLALAAHHRGFAVEIYVSERGVMFVDSVRSHEKKEVMRLVQEDFLRELRALPVTIHYETLNVAGMQAALEAGGMPIVLISSYRIYHEKVPHWVVVTGFDGTYIYVHDPFVDAPNNKTALECMNMPIAKNDFEHMARYGKTAQKAVVIVSKRH